MEYFINENGTTETKVNSEDERIKNKPYETFLQENESNVLIATRNFQHRVKSFRSQLLKGNNNPINIKIIVTKLNSKVEKQPKSMGHCGWILERLKDQHLSVKMEQKNLQNI